MKILIIGNGFDLAHHLPTQYSEFLDFVKAYKEGGDSEYSDVLQEFRIKKKKIYDEIELLIHNNVLLAYFLSIYKERCREGKKGWIDFESEISVLVRNLDKAKMELKGSNTGNQEHSKMGYSTYTYLSFFINRILKNRHIIFARTFFFISEIDDMANSILEDLNRLTRLLEIYLHEFVEEEKRDYRLPDIEGFKFDHVLSFNYTDTYRKYYDKESNAQYCFIHGKAKESRVETCNLVLGIDEYLSNSRVDSDNQFVWFKKFYQRIFKETGSEYLDWINEFKNNNRHSGLSGPINMEIYIYGHSLDVTDKDILSRLILMDNAKTHIFYHNREAMGKQISNLVKIIGEENLIRMTGGTDRAIKFIKSEEAYLKHV